MSTHLLLGGETRKIIDQNGKLWNFEDHPRMGPIPTTPQGDELKKEPGPRSGFWVAAQAWVDQGRKVESGACVWEMPRPEYKELIHLGGNNYRPVFWEDELQPPSKGL